jgi:hypothetical protein
MCFETEGTLSLSEIAFDKNHTYALVGFGVRCGLRCGYGRIVVLEKVNGNWQQIHICREWYI